MSKRHKQDRRKNRDPLAVSEVTLPAASLVAPGVSLIPEGLRVGDKIVPLLVGTMHYWHHEPYQWEACLDAMVAMGFRIVDTYVPWAVHEDEPRVFDFGDRTPAKNVARFLELAHKRGLYVILRPGPHINAELTHFGIPERIIWDPECQARTPRNHPVVLPMFPRAFPVPSYASEVFFEEVARWFQAVGSRLRHLVAPHGPIVMVQVDNEGALYFRDGPYDQDYHPDAVAKFRDFLRTQYGSTDALAQAWGVQSASFAKVEPPKRFDAKSVSQLAPHLDWMAFHERLLASAMGRMSVMLRESGFEGIPFSHNFPLGEAVTALNATRVAKAVDLIGIDYYHRANPTDHAVLMRRTSELVSRCDGRGVPPFGAEMGAGGPPFLPAMDEVDSLFTVMAALAYGLRGFNTYMAVDRDRWIGAPIDERGKMRPFAKRWKALISAVNELDLVSLRRRAPVRLVVPRLIRRLGRAMHAFGPVTPTLFHVLGAGYTQSVAELTLGLPDHPVLAAEEFLRTFEVELLRAGVPFAYAGSESVEESSASATWIVTALGPGASPELFRRLRLATDRGAHVTIGPRIPELDGNMQPLRVPHEVSGFEFLEGGSSIGDAVRTKVSELGITTCTIEPSDCATSVLVDAANVERVLFVLNPTAEKVLARIGARFGRVTDALDGSTWRGDGTVLEIPMDPRTVRMLQITELSTSPKEHG